MAKFKHKLSGWMLKGVFSAFGSLPMPVLYGISSGVAWLAGDVIGYRRKVVRQNLRSSFPEKTDAELRDIEKKFYRFLCDYFVETLRLGRMDADEISRRMVYEGQEEVNRCLESGRNVSLVLGHLGNWEWSSSIPLHLPAGIHAGQIYHPLENEGADEAFLKIRGRFGATSIRMKDTLPTIMRWRKEGKPFIIGYISDQSPVYEAIHCFTPFLNHDTAAITGHERLSRMLHAAVFYCEISRPERGKYVCRYVQMTDDAAKLPQFELTHRFYRLLEENIRLRPELWLWSHKRWKRGRKEFYEHFGQEEAEVRLTRL